MIYLQNLNTLEQTLWITIITTLFILSLISERVANLIKLYFQSLYEAKPVKTGSIDSTQIPKEDRDNSPGRIFGNLRYRQHNPDLEKQREKGIQTVAILCGILVAIFSGADLFMLIKTGKMLDWQAWFKTHSLYDFWSVFTNIKLFSHALGAVFAGLFISLGAKFWHDVLDFVLYSGNLKRKLADERTFTSTRIEEVDEWLAMQLGDLGRRAHDQYAAALNQHNNVAYIIPTSQYYNGVYQDVIRVYLKDNDDSRFQRLRSLPVKLESGRTVDVPIVFVTGVGDIPQIHGAALKGVAINKKGTNFTGTFCCLLQDEDNEKSLFFLTCNHVLTEGKFRDLSDAELAANIEVEIHVNSKTIAGIWHESIQNDFFDLALIRPKNPQFNPDTIFGSGISLAPNPRVVSKQEANGLLVNVLRRLKDNGNPDDSSNAQKARIHDLHLNKSVPIEYANGKIANIQGLFEVENEDRNGPVSVKGDSGTLIYDDTNQAVGMIIAGNKRFSYAIRLSDITTKTSKLIFPAINS